VTDTEHLAPPEPTPANANTPVPLTKDQAGSILEHVKSWYESGYQTGAHWAHELVACIEKILGIKPPSKPQ
jgi:hypothetical protein